MFFCHLKEDIRVKRESSIKKSFREKASLSRKRSVIFKNKERDFWLVLGLFTIMGPPLPASWPLQQCCLSPGQRGQGWEESLPPSPALPQGSGQKEPWAAFLSLSTPSRLLGPGKRANRAGNQAERFVIPPEAPNCEFNPFMPLWDWPQSPPLACSSWETKELAILSYGAAVDRS